MPYADPETQREYQRERVARVRAEWLEGKACVACGSTERLHVHHIDPTQKIGHNVWSWAPARRAAELAKCEVRCKPCHIAKHLPPLPDHGTYARYDAAPPRACRCDECRAANAARNRSARARRAAILTT